MSQASSEFVSVCGGFFFLSSFVPWLINCPLLPCSLAYVYLKLSQDLAELGVWFLPRATPMPYCCMVGAQRQGHNRWPSPGWRCPTGLPRSSGDLVVGSP